VNGLLTSIGGTLRNSRRDARPVEPAGPVKDLFPVDHASFNTGYGRMRAIVNDLAAATDGTGFQEVDSQALPAPGNVVSPNPAFAHFHHGAPAEVVVGQAGHKVHRDPVIGQGNSYIGFSASVNDIQRVGLRKSQMIRRGKPHHDFTESNYFFHN